MEKNYMKGFQIYKEGWKSKDGVAIYLRNVLADYTEKIRVGRMVM